MHKRPLCRRAVSVCLSVYLSVRSCILSKRINISSKFFHHRAATSFWFFHTKMLWQYSDRDPLTGAKIPFFDQYMALASITAGPSRVVNISTVQYSTNASSVSRDQQTPPRHASVNLVYDRKLRRYAEDNTIKFNYTH